MHKQGMQLLLNFMKLKHLADKNYNRPQEDVGLIQNKNFNN